MKRKHLYIVAAVIWGIPGIIITSKGIGAYTIQPAGNLWWLFLITAAVLAGFFLMFRRIVNRYSDRIASLPDKVRIWQTFPLHFIPAWALCFFCPPEDFCTTQGESYLCRKDTFYERRMPHLQSAARIF